jgi:hypothetical protein
MVLLAIWDEPDLSFRVMVRKLLVIAEWHRGVIFGMDKYNPVPDIPPLDK